MLALDLIVFSWTALTNPVARIDACPSATPMIGPANAPIAISLLLDPLQPEALTTYLETKRMIAQQDGLVRVDMHVVGSGSQARAREDRVRAWVAGELLRGNTLAALRVLDGYGFEHVHSRLTTRGGRAWLAHVMGIHTLVGRDDPCDFARIQAVAEAFQRAKQGGSELLPRPAVFVFPNGRLLQDGPPLARLDTELARLRQQRLSSTNVQPIPAISARASRSEQVMRLSGHSGAVLGGVGLPHELVLFPTGEHSPLLGPALTHRARYPASMSVHVVARGRSPAAEQLRGRLCAARVAKYELEYFRYLARDRDARPIETHERPMLEKLDEIAQSPRCSGEQVVSMEDVAPEAWLDGVPVSAADLQLSSPRLGARTYDGSPIDAVIAPVPEH